MARKGSRRVALYGALVVALLVPGCNGSDDARAMWRDAVKKCAKNDLIGPNVLFFGPSNALGPGTVFQIFSDGGVQATKLLEQYLPSTSGLFAPERPFDCGASFSATTNLGVSVSLEQALSVSATVSSELKKARKITVTAKAFHWDTLLGDVYRDRIAVLPVTDSTKADLLARKRVVLARALRVKDFVAELEFDTAVGGSVNAKVPDGIIPLAGAGNAKASLDAHWQGNTKLVLTAPAEFYIAGELRYLTKEGLEAGSSVIGPIVPNAEKFKVRPMVIE